MTGKPITALSALRGIMAAGWQSDELAKDAATDLLVVHGLDEAEARREVEAAFAKHFAVMGGV